MGTIIHWLEQHMLPCLNMQLFGFSCPGCGLQRSVISVLKGEIAESLHQYPPLPFMVLLLAVLGFHLLKGSAKSMLLLKIIYFATLAVILTNYITNLITH